MAKKKFYVVWKGRQRGIFSSWEECEARVKGFTGAEYLGFESRALAEQAFRGTYEEFRDGKARAARLSRGGGGPQGDSIAVDAACSGNPGPVEYRGIHVGEGREVFRLGPIAGGTNNIGEFLGIVHALAYLRKKGSDWPIYSDSTQAIGWVKAKRCGTKLPRTEDNRKVFELIRSAEIWLEKFTYANEIRKWKTGEWGEIPADFGRK